MEKRIIEYRQLVYILAMFMIVQLVGLLTMFYFVPPSAIATVPVTSMTSTSSGIGAGAQQVLVFLIYIIMGTIVLLLIFRFYHGTKIYAIIEGLVVISASFYFFAIILGSIFASQSDTPYVLVASLAIPIVLLAAKYKMPKLRNELAVIASIGAGIVLGLVFPLAIAFIFMAAIAVYDYVAVFITRHMLALGRQAMNQNMALMIGSSDTELVPKNYVDKKYLKEFKKNVRLADIRNTQIKTMIKGGAVLVPTQAALGTGDLAIPLMLAVSAYATYASSTITAHASFLIALVVTAGAAIGMVFTMYVLRNYKIALPAIPPLFSFVSMALGAFYAVSGLLYIATGLFLVGIGVIGIMLVTVRRIAGQKGRSVF
ncbi:MAG: presenilin family intramembrane aspartyl protease [Candidatus Micrarchaeia archaeon]